MLISITYCALLLQPSLVLIFAGFCHTQVYFSEFCEVTMQSLSQVALILRLIDKRNTKRFVEILGKQVDNHH